MARNDCWTPVVGFNGAIGYVSSRHRVASVLVRYDLWASVMARNDCWSSVMGANGAIGYIGNRY